VPPFGLAGGSAGEPGRNWVERHGGDKEEFGATFQVEMRTGDVFVVRTPGGGGFGAPQDRTDAAGARKPDAGSA
jgi:N-methylhydantoinase B/oxoprolinase/acetone carboxylase alpha subunit